MSPLLLKYSLLHIFPSELIFLPLSYSNTSYFTFSFSNCFFLPSLSYPNTSFFFFPIQTSSPSFFYSKSPFAPLFFFEHLFHRIFLFEFYSPISSNYLYFHIALLSLLPIPVQTHPFSNFPIRSPTSAFSLSELLFLQLSYSNTHVFFFIRNASSSIFTIRTSFS